LDFKAKLCHFIPNFDLKISKKARGNKIFADDVCLRAKRWFYLSWFGLLALVTASGTFAGFLGGAGGASLFAIAGIGGAGFFRLNVVLHGYFLSSCLFLSETSSVGEILDQFELKISVLFETEIGEGKILFKSLFETFTGIDSVKVRVDLRNELPETINVFFGRINDEF
jgi:hypothetical protein